MHNLRYCSAGTMETLPASATMLVEAVRDAVAAVGDDRYVCSFLFDFLTVQEVGRAALVCRAWRAGAYDDELWRELYERTQVAEADMEEWARTLASRPFGEDAVGWEVEVYIEEDGVLRQGLVMEFRDPEYRVVYADGTSCWESEERSHGPWHQRGNSRFTFIRRLHDSIADAGGEGGVGGGQPDRVPSPSPHRPASTTATETRGVGRGMESGRSDRHRAAASGQWAGVRHGSWREELKENACHVPSSMLTRLDDHNDEVLDVKFSPDGKLLATCSRDSYIFVYALENTQQQQQQRQQQRQHDNANQYSDVERVPHPPIWARKHGEANTSNASDPLGATSHAAFRTVSAGVLGGGVDSTMGDGGALDGGFGGEECLDGERDHVVWSLGYGRLSLRLVHRLKRTANASVCRLFCSVELWDTCAGQLLSRCKSQPFDVHAAWMPDGKHFVVGLDVQYVQHNDKWPIYQKLGIHRMSPPQPLAAVGDKGQKVPPFSSEEGQGVGWGEGESQEAFLPRSRTAAAAAAIGLDSIALAASLSSELKDDNDISGRSRRRRAKLDRRTEAAVHCGRDGGYTFAYGGDGDDFGGGGRMAPSTLERTSTCRKANGLAVEGPAAETSLSLSSSSSLSSLEIDSSGSVEAEDAPHCVGGGGDNDAYAYPGEDCLARGTMAMSLVSFLSLEEPESPEGVAWADEGSEYLACEAQRQASTNARQVEGKGNGSRAATTGSWAAGGRSNGESNRHEQEQQQQQQQIRHARTTWQFERAESAAVQGTLVGAGAGAGAVLREDQEKNKLDTMVDDDSEEKAEDMDVTEEDSDVRGQGHTHDKRERHGQGHDGHQMGVYRNDYYGNSAFEDDGGDETDGGDNNNKESSDKSNPSRRNNNDASGKDHERSASRDTIAFQEQYDDAESGWGGVGPLLPQEASVYSPAIAAGLVGGGPAGAAAGGGIGGWQQHQDGGVEWVGAAGAEQANDDSDISLVGEIHLGMKRNFGHFFGISRSGAWACVGTGDTRMMCHRISFIPLEKSGLTAMTTPTAQSPARFHCGNGRGGGNGECGVTDAGSSQAFSLSGEGSNAASCMPDSRFTSSSGSSSAGYTGGGEQETNSGDQVGAASDVHIFFRDEYSTATADTVHNHHGPESMTRSANADLGGTRFVSGGGGVDTINSGAGQGEGAAAVGWGGGGGGAGPVAGDGEREVDWTRHASAKMDSVECGGALLSLCISRDDRLVLANVRPFMAGALDKIRAESPATVSSPDIFNDVELQVWDVESKRMLLKLGGHHAFTTKDCPFLLFAAQSEADRFGDYVASGSEERDVFVWHLRHRCLLASLKGHTDVVNSVAWNSAEPGLMASGSDDGTVIIWGPKVHRR